MAPVRGAWTAPPCRSALARDSAFPAKPIARKRAPASRIEPSARLAREQRVQRLTQRRDLGLERVDPHREHNLAAA